jgi:stress response protein YsnF
MLSEREVSTSIGNTAYGSDGDKLGTVEHFYLDDRTGTPTWVAVTTGLFGTRTSIAPAVAATLDESGGLRVPVTAEAVKTAPHLTGEHLTPEDEAELRRHYGIDQGLGGTGTPPAPTAAPTQAIDVGAAELPPPPSPPRQNDGSMTRSEERLVVGTERVATTRARLIKYVVTEEVQITVPIRREEIRVEEVPIDEPDLPGESLTGVASSGVPGGTTGGLPDEIILHTERPVVTVEVVPVERVRLRTVVVEGQETITEQVQREQIVVDQHASPRPQGV